MKYEIALLENAGAKIRARQQGADFFGGILVFHKEEHGAFGQRAAVANDLGKERIVCAALQTVNDEGKRLFCMKLLLHRENHAFIFTVAPYELGDSHL